MVGGAGGVRRLADDRAGVEELDWCVAIDHCSGHANHEVLGEGPHRAQILRHEGVLARGQPELGVGAQVGHLHDVHEVPHALQIPAVVPANIVYLSLTLFV